MLMVFLMGIIILWRMPKNTINIVKRFIKEGSQSFGG